MYNMAAKSINELYQQHLSLVTFKTGSIQSSCFTACFCGLSQWNTLYGRCCILSWVLHCYDTDILYFICMQFFFFSKHISMKNCGHLLVETNSLASSLSYVCIYTSFVELSSCLIVGCLVVCLLCTSLTLEAVTDKKA